MKHDRKISVIGLGYVGLPVALAFGRRGRVIAFDIDESRLAELRKGRDRTREVTGADLASADLVFTSDGHDLALADFHIVAVPTPVDDAHQPDFAPLSGASRTVGRVLKRGDIVVFESTVYPGATEEVCVPILERTSGLACGVDFAVGYSPERINPGDREHKFDSICKVVSGCDAATLDVVASVYGSVVKAGVHRAPSIKVAEAAKVIENTQRDLNIALVNELAVLFDRLGVDTQDVLAAAGTKWNFLHFRPGLVGGHCIGVDPYYLTHKAERLGYIPQVILAGRRINDSMGAFIGQQTVKQLIHAGHNVSQSSVTVLGLTFKEDCPDLRNSRVIDVVRELESFGVRVQVVDPEADPQAALEEYGIRLVPADAVAPADAVVLAVAHRHFRNWDVPRLRRLMKEQPVLVDVKGVCDRAAAAAAGIRLWRL